MHPTLIVVRRHYVQTVIAIGLFVVAYSLWQVAVNPPGFEWFVLAALTLLTGSFTVRIPGLPARISVSETFTFTSVLLFGPAVGTVTVTLDALVISFWLDRSKRPPLKVFFNAAAPSIAIWVASEMFFYVSGAQPGEISREDIARLIVPVFAFAALYFLINTGLVAGALATERHDSVFRLWTKNFPGVSINYFVGGSIAMLPRWTGQNRPFVDTSKPAISSGRDRGRVSSTARCLPTANPYGPSFASSVARTSAHAHDAAGDRVEP